MSGASVGCVLIFTLSGYITALLGWSAVFYVTGAASLAWAAAWFLLVADTPASHPHITQQERHLIGGLIPPEWSFRDHKELSADIFLSCRAQPVCGCQAGPEAAGGPLAPNPHLASSLGHRAGPHRQ